MWKRNTFFSSRLRRLKSHRQIGAWIASLACAALPAMAAEPVHTFETDPGWEKFGETALGAPNPRTIKQDFGWRPTNKAGGAAPGEIGGIMSRSSFTRSTYWKEIPTKTLEDKLSISGRFAVPHTDNDSAM